MVDFYNGKDESYKKVKIACQYKYSSVEKTIPLNSKSMNII